MRSVGQMHFFHPAILNENEIIIQHLILGGACGRTFGPRGWWQLWDAICCYEPIYSWNIAVWIFSLFKQRSPRFPNIQLWQLFADFYSCISIRAAGESHCHRPDHAVVCFSVRPRFFLFQHFEKCISSWVNGFHLSTWLTSSKTRMPIC